MIEAHKTTNAQFKGISSNGLKIIAAIAMLIDHLGAEVFTDVEILRWIGRLSFPIFAYFIYHGCQKTHSLLKYFLKIFLLGLICITVYYLFSGVFYANILITFSFSICLNGCVKLVKKKKSMLHILTLA